METTQTETSEMETTKTEMTDVEATNLEVMKTNESGPYFAQVEEVEEDGNEASAPGAWTEIKRAELKMAKIKEMPISILGKSRRRSLLASCHLEEAWRIVVSKAEILRKLLRPLTVRRARHKSLSVVETVALGDRRFVSVIEFAAQRFLMGSSPASITLLAALRERVGGGEASGEDASGERE